MKKFVLLLAAVSLMACAAKPALDTSAERSFDGLVKIKHSAFKDAWIEPEVELSRYNKILIEDVNFEFRAVRGPSSDRPTDISRPEKRYFAIGDKDKAKLVETVTSIFKEQLTSTKYFTTVDEAGPDVLIVRASLLDIVSQTPPQMVSAGEIYVSSLGRANLVLELVDSLSGETLYRGTELSKVQRPDRELMETNPVTTWAEVRRWANRWAGKVKRGLDSVHE